MRSWLRKLSVHTTFSLFTTWICCSFTYAFRTTTIKVPSHTAPRSLAFEATYLIGDLEKDHFERLYRQSRGQSTLRGRTFSESWQIRWSFGQTTSMKSIISISTSRYQYCPLCWVDGVKYSIHLLLHLMFLPCQCPLTQPFF